MITAKNYYATIEQFGRSNIHPDLREMVDLVDEVTEKGKNWSLYDQDKEIRETVDLYFTKLNSFLERKGKMASAPKKSVVSSSRETSVTKSKVKSGSKKHPMRIVSRTGEPVERIAEELRFIRRFTLLNGKTKTKDQIRLFLNGLQRAITEKRIRKTSSYAKEIELIQDALIELYSSMSSKKMVKVEIDPGKLTSLQNLCGKEELMLSVRFIKSYIGLQGKLIENAKARNLFNRIGRAINSERITSKDPYFKQVSDMLNTLEAFVKKYPTEGTLEIPERELNGIDFLSGLNGIEEIEDTDEFDRAPRNVVMNSLDFVKLNFKTIQFKGKWFDFIGNPSPGFMALVAAPAKYGKSILCVDWAAYLARNHGKVLYVAREEGLDQTLQNKLMEAAHENLVVADHIPDDLSPYQFIFFDSITMLHIKPSDIEYLKSQYPNKGLVFISQVNKSGTARGSNEFYHNVDIIIEFPEIGRAVQYGRFNQGGEMDVFE